MVCYKCKRDTQIQVMVAPGQTVCQECRMHMEPFVMDIVLDTNYSGLYITTFEMAETVMTVDDFQKCGWFLRCKEERGTFVFYTLEYHGKVECSRCVGFNFPIGMKDCHQYNRCSWYHQKMGAGKAQLKG